MDAPFFASPGPAIVSVGSFSLRWYSVLILGGIVLGTALAQRLGRVRGIDPERIADLAVWIVVGAIPAARAYYVFFEWPRFALEPWWKVFAVWEGGIAIHGALLGGLSAGWLFARSRQLSFATLLDVCAPALALGQAIGRWGNFFNSEAFGAPTDLPWKLFIPPERRPPGLEAFAFYHPTFLYESLWNLGVLGVLLAVFFRLPRLKPGSVACVYAIGYSLGRLWIEGLRTDSLMLGPLRVAQVVSLALIALGLFGLWWLNRSRASADAVEPKLNA
jgi:phosphatidylglycerol:prolipoprotein diacylglycerol transferase